jgi:hypothetical protein
MVTDAPAQLIAIVRTDAIAGVSRPQDLLSGNARYVQFFLEKVLS